MELTLEYIYAFKCPLSKNVVYVGKTSNPEMRFKGHIKGCFEVGYWYRAMVSIGHTPIFEIIDFTYGDSMKIERQYIEYYTSMGLCCFNVHGNKLNNKNKKTCTVIYSLGKRKADYHPAIIKEKDQLATDIYRKLSSDGINRYSVLVLREIKRILSHETI